MHTQILKIGIVLHFTGEPLSLPELRAHIAERARGIPALSAAIGGGIGGGSGSGNDLDRGPRWARLPLDLAAHVRGLELPGGGAVEDAVSGLADAEFPRGGPPWDMTLLYGYAPGRYALVYRVSHGVLDMGGVAHTVEALFGPGALPPERSSAVARGLEESPGGTARHGVAAARLLAGATAKSGVWPHPDHPFSAKRAYAWADVPRDALRDGARPYGGTCNDAYVAALARVTGAWLAEYAPHAYGRGAPMNVAVNLRGPGEADILGNHVVSGRLMLPGQEASPEQVFAATLRGTAPLKSPARRAAVRRLVRGSQRLVRSLPPRLMGLSTRAFLSPERAAVLCSNFVLRNPLRWRDDPVHAVDGVTALPPGVPLSVLLITYQERASAVFVSDPALPGMDKAHQHWQRIVHEQAATARSPLPPTLPPPTPRVRR
ncbi:wax ester/triacylglycerol synthase domain-containing protein [Streptomyces varsoviensis]|uniref:wax ester/triacylglycerol synthase domain-containing protein n=1 Tax=Streptomyces varsoviensis TaxID=67373 RepID=UPI0033FD91FA